MWMVPGIGTRQCKPWIHDDKEIQLQMVPPIMVAKVCYSAHPCKLLYLFAGNLSI